MCVAASRVAIGALARPSGRARIMHFGVPLTVGLVPQRLTRRFYPTTWTSPDEKVSAMMKRQNRTREAEVQRKTKETNVRVKLNLDGDGHSRISTGLPFLDHMLDLFAKHGLFNLEVVCKGDLEIDDHHSVEDIAITLGQALIEALGDKLGVKRYGEAIVPMDEALCRSVIDLSGRFYLVYELATRRQKIGNFSIELAEHL